MDELWRAIASIATALHKDRVEAAATHIEGFGGPSEVWRHLSAFGPGTEPSLIHRFHAAWSALPTISPPEIAAALRASARTSLEFTANESIDLVWTGPGTGLIPTRKTEQVVREIVEESARQLFLVSYVFYKASSVVTALNDASARGVSIRILLESHDESGGTVSIDGLGAMRQAVPAAELYTWTAMAKTKTSGAMQASVHAKCVVADHRAAFVTSANLTAAALERNMELGVLLRGGIMPSRLHSHLDALVSTSIVTRWA